VGTAAQASAIALWTGVAVLAPALRDELGLSLTQVGVVIAAPWIGPIFTLIPWGLLADRAGERIVLAAGLGLCALLTIAVAFTSAFAAIVVLLGLAGASGASTNAASGRAVMSWFAAEERGFALGIRQASTPLGIMIASLALPAFERAGGLQAAFLFLAAFSLAAAVAGALVLRDVAAESGVEETPRVLRDRRLWLLGASGALYLIPQIAITGFLVLFLHDERGLSVQGAAAVLAVIQVIAIPLRIAIGRWSDILGDRIEPLRLVGLAGAVTLGATAALLAAPTAVVVAGFVVAGAASMAWNGLSFTAAAELTGRARSGAAIGFQQTVLSMTLAVSSPAFAGVVEASSWQAAFAVAALFPLAGVLPLAPLSKRALHKAGSSG
jgi:sugar phosphate permease